MNFSNRQSSKKSESSRRLTDRQNNDSSCERITTNGLYSKLNPIVHTNSGYTTRSSTGSRTRTTLNQTNEVKRVETRIQNTPDVCKSQPHINKTVDIPQEPVNTHTHSTDHQFCSSNVQIDTVGSQNTCISSDDTSSQFEGSDVQETQRICITQEPERGLSDMRSSYEDKTRGASNNIRVTNLDVALENYNPHDVHHSSSVDNKQTSHSAAQKCDQDGFIQIKRDSQTSNEDTKPENYDLEKVSEEKEIFQRFLNELERAAKFIDHIQRFEESHNKEHTFNHVSGSLLRSIDKLDRLDIDDNKLLNDERRRILKFFYALQKILEKKAFDFEAKNSVTIDKYSYHL